jgi:hypothetical protein
MLHKYYGMTPLCPICNAADEMIIHVLSYPSPYQFEYKRSLLARFMIQLQSIGTPSLIGTLIQHGMTSFLALLAGMHRTLTYGSVKPTDVLATQCTTCGMNY